MRTSTYLLRLLLLLTAVWPSIQSVSAQPTLIGNTNGTLLCPGREYIFTVSAQQGSTNCQALWTISNGSSRLPNPGPTGIMRVAFNDVLGGAATLQATLSGCGNTTDNGVSQTLTVYIRSITNLPLGALTLNGGTSGNIEFGSTAPVTLEVPLLTIPRNSNEPNPVTQVAGGYEWTIPAGWRWPDGTLSTGAPRLFNSRSVSNPNRIVVTPPANACGSSSSTAVTVRAVDTECLIGSTTGYVPTRSAEKTLTVNCVTPPLTIISNRTPNGGPLTLFCGQSLGNEQVRVSTANVPAGGSFTNYSFTTSGIVGSAGGLNTATPALFVTGPGSGSIGLSATYSRNGVSTAVSAAPVTVTVQPQVAPLTLKPFAAVCPGQSLRVEVLPVPGATSYVWTIPHPFSPMGTVTTPASQPYLDISTLPSTPNHEFTVQVEARSSGCAPSLAQRTGILGIGAYATIGSDANPTRTEICPDSYITLWPHIVKLRPGYYDYGANWTITKRDPSTGATTTYTETGQTISVLTPPLGHWLDVEMRAVSGCGNFEMVAAAWQTTFDYQNGQSCVQVAGRTAPALLAYPNPADEQLFLPEPTSPYTLFDSYGQPVRAVRSRSTQSAEPTARPLDTRKLPTGLYYLLRQDASGATTRQTIEVKH